MNKQEFFADLKEIITDKIYIGDSVSELQDESSNNKWGISISQELCEITKKQELLDFFEAVIENRKEQILNSKKNHGMLFYLWFDEQAGELRFNLISEFHTKLPFRAKYNVIDKPDEIIEDFLNYKYHDGIPFEDFVEVTEENNSEEKFDESKYIFNVYCLNIRKQKIKNFVY